MDDKPLSHKVIKGGFWVFLIRILGQLLNFIRLIILARILAPADFGLMGIALLTMTTLETFSQTGFQTALIQKKKDIKEYLDAAWTVLIIRGIILFAILYFIAPIAATFFDASAAKPIIQVIGFSIFIHAFTNIGIVYFQKELEFNKQFIYEFIGTLSDFVVAVSAALILRNVWALVFGLLAGNMARLIVSYRIHPYRPRISHDLKKAKELWGFGKWVLGATILTFLITQGDDIFVGKIVGVAALGFYQLAYKISNMPTTELTHVITRVSFPAYSKIQDSKERLKRAYLKIFKLVSIVAFPLSGGIFIFAPAFTQLILGAKWQPAVSSMQALALYGLIRSVGATTGPLFNALGKPKYVVRLQTIQLVLIALLIYPLTVRWGILGTSLAITITAVIIRPITDNIVRKSIGLPFLHYLKLLCFPLLITAMSCAFMLVINYAWSANSGLFPLITQIVLFIFMYAGLTFLFDSLVGHGLKDIIRNIIGAYVK